MRFIKLQLHKSKGNAWFIGQPVDGEQGLIEPILSTVCIFSPLSLSLFLSLFLPASCFFFFLLIVSLFNPRDWWCPLLSSSICYFSVHWAICWQTAFHRKRFFPPFSLTYFLRLSTPNTLVSLSPLWGWVCSFLRKWQSTKHYAANNTPRTFSSSLSIFTWEYVL